jgi:hypothetical protein
MDVHVMKLGVATIAPSVNSVRSIEQPYSLVLDDDDGDTAICAAAVMSIFAVKRVESPDAPSLVAGAYLSEGDVEVRERRTVRPNVLCQKSVEDIDQAAIAQLGVPVRTEHPETFFKDQIGGLHA